MRYPGRELDYIAKSLDQFGSMTISGTTLIDPDPRFAMDLNMSAKEMFDRTRLEGFSTLLQEDHLDVQLSVEAQIVQQMLQETASSASPGETAQLSQKVQAAAWRSLLAQVPGGAEMAEAFQKSGQSESASSENTGGGVSSGEFLGDGGQASLSNARLSLDQANQHLKKAGELYKNVGPDEVKELSAGVSASLDQMINEGDLYHAGIVDTLNNIENGAREAMYLTYEVKQRINTAPDTLRSSLESFNVLVNNAEKEAQDADGMRKALKTALDGLKKKYADEVKVQTPSDLEKAKKKANDAKTVLETAIKATFNESECAIEDAIKKAELAAKDAVAAARAVQLPVTPSVPILKAKEIEKSKRLAMERLLPQKDFPILKDPGTAPELNLRQLLLLTANDKSTLEMLRWLSYPQAYGPGKRVYLCMTTVSCMPGNRTLSGFRGQIDLSLELARVEPDYASGENKIKKLGTAPQVFCAYPLIDSQVLDLRTSRRVTLTAAMQLVVTGFPKAANALLDFASSRGQNIETLTGVNTVTSFGAGNHVGFTFSPKLRAQADPTKLNTKPAWILDMQTFPAIIMIVIDEDDLITSNPETGANTLIWRQNHRWMPLQKTNFGLMNDPAFSESELGRRAQCLENAYWELQKGLDEENYATSFPAETLEKRVEYFKTMALGKDIFMSLPLFDTAKENCCGSKEELKVNPNLVWHDSSTTLLVKLPKDWTGFAEVTVAGKPVNAVPLSQKMLRVVVPPIGELVGIKGKDEDNALYELDPGIVVSNGAGMLRKKLKVARLNPVAAPKTPDATPKPPETAPKPAQAAAVPDFPAFIKETYVGYVDKPAAIDFKTLGREQRFVIKLWGPIKNKAGKSITEGTLIYRSSTDTSLRCSAIVTETEIQQKDMFKRTGDGTYSPATINTLFDKNSVSIFFEYSEEDGRKTEKSILGSVRFYKD